jgi:hypothetical protein
MDFATLWNTVRGLPGRAAAPTMDDELHGERLLPAGGKRTWTARCDELPDFTFVHWPQVAPDDVLHRPALLRAQRIHAWTMGGYGRAIRITPDALLEVLTPKSIVSVLGAGYLPVLHSSLYV